MQNEMNRGEPNRWRRSGLKFLREAVPSAECWQKIAPCTPPGAPKKPRPRQFVPRLLTAALVLLAACATPPRERPIPARRDGINMHPDREVNPAAAARQFADCREIGLGQARRRRVGDHRFPRRGQFDFSTMDRTPELAEANGVELLEVLCYNAPWNSPIPGSTKTMPADLAAFGDFVEHMAKRYRGRIRAWEVWNGSNADTFLTGPYAEHPEQRWHDYAAILETAYRSLKRVDPANTVVFGGLAHTSDHWWTDLEACYEAGALRWCDVLAIHPYAGRAIPSAIPGRALHRRDPARDGGARRRSAARMDHRGRSPDRGPRAAVSEAQQAGNIEPTFRVALRRPQVQRIYYYALRDDGESFGLFRSDGTPKPAAARLRDLCRGARWRPPRLSYDHIEPNA